MQLYFLLNQTVENAPLWFRFSVWPVPLLTPAGGGCQNGLEMEWVEEKKDLGQGAMKINFEKPCFLKMRLIK